MTTGQNLYITSIFNLLVGIVLLLVWYFLKLKEDWSKVFFPTAIVRGEDTKRLSKDNPIKWAKRMLFEDGEERVRQTMGLDGVTFHRIFTFAILWLTAAAGLGLLILLPVFATGDGINRLVQKNNQYYADNPDKTYKPLAFSGIDNCSMANVAPNDGRLVAALFVMWILSLWAYYLLLVYYKRYAADRVHWFANDTDANHYSIFVSDIPKEEAKTDEDLALVTEYHEKHTEAEAKMQAERDKPPGFIAKLTAKLMKMADPLAGVIDSGKVYKPKEMTIEQYFRGLYPHSFYSLLPVKNFAQAYKDANTMVKYQIKLESSEFKAQKFVDDDKRDKEGNIKKPIVKDGFCGCCGTKHDAVEWYTEKLDDSVKQLQATQDAVRASEMSTAVISFKSRAAAAVATQTLHHGDSMYYNVRAAPEPSDFYWPNVGMTSIERGIRELVVLAVTAAMVLFFMIPITLLSALTTLPNLYKFAPWLKPLVEGAGLSAFLSGFLPTLALLAFNALLPTICKALTTQEGVIALSDIDKGASWKVFVFLAVNSWFGFCVSGSVFNNLVLAIQNPTSIPSILAAAVPPTATFFMLYVALQAFIVQPLELSRIVPLILYQIKKRAFASTSRQLTNIWRPAPMDYVVRVPAWMYILLLAMIYSVIQPLFPIFALVMFAIGLLIWRNQMVYVYAQVYDAGGCFWPMVNDQIFTIMLIWQLLMLGLFFLKSGFAVGILTIPLPILTVGFSKILKKRFERTCSQLPLDTAMTLDGLDASTGPPDITFLETAYTPEFMAPPEEILEANAPEKVLETFTYANRGEVQRSASGKVLDEELGPVKSDAAMIDVVDDDGSNGYATK